MWQSSALVQQYLAGARGAVPLAAEQIDVMMHLILARGEPVRRFLDLGCGSGLLTAAIVAQFPAAAGVLLDVSGPARQAAREQLKPHLDTLHFVNGDFGDPGWVEAVAAHSPFEVVVSGYAIHSLPDTRKRALYAEIFNLLKPGGLFLNTDHVASPGLWLKQVFADYFINAPVSFAAGHGPTPLETQNHWLREAGYVDVDCYFKVFELAVFGGRRP